MPAPRAAPGQAVGLIAGRGELPLAVAREMRAKGYRVVVVGFRGLADPGLSDEVDSFSWVDLGKLGSLLNLLRKENVGRAVLAGKVSKTLAYPLKAVPDLRAMKLFFSLPDRRDDTIMTAFTNELQREGIEILETTDFTESLMAENRTLSKRGPTQAQWEDIRFGLGVAREIGRLDIGQTVVVKDKAVMAVEAIEGTDEAIRRGGRLAGEGSVVVKVAKPQQDFRFDVPAVGSDTLTTMRESAAAVLALEAGKVIVMNRDAVVRDADEAGIVVVGCGD